MAVLEKRVPAVARKSRKKSAGIAQSEARWGLIFLSPWILGFLIFTLLPMVASLVFSVTSFNPIHADQTQFVGLKNYGRLFTDPGIANAVSVTLKFALIAVPISLAVPLGLAVLVNSPRLFGQNVFRTLFYMPYMVPVVVGVMVWGGILNSDSGWLNRALGFIGIQGPRWLQDVRWVGPAIAIMGIWGVGNTMLTMLAGLQNVPTELYEAAKVDGASPLHSFFNITVPMITPVLFYNLVLALIGAFQQFTAGYIIGNGRGDPNGATMFYNLYLYKTSFSFMDMGYGATLAWAMFVVVLIITIILFQTQNRWVYYGGGED